MTELEKYEQRYQILLTVLRLEGVSPAIDSDSQVCKVAKIFQNILTAKRLMEEL